jgi:hypothetical protein
MTCQRVRVVRRRFAAVVVCVAMWSAGELFADLVPWKLVAAASAAVLFAAAAHAFTIGFYLRLIRSIADAFRLRPVWPRVVAAVVIATMGAIYWVAVSGDGPARQLAVEAVFLLGLAFYVARRDVARELRESLMRVGR